MKTFKEFSLEDKLSAIVHKEIIKRKLAKVAYYAYDDHKMRNTKPVFKIPYKKDMEINVYIKKQKPNIVNYQYSLEDK